MPHAFDTGLLRPQRTLIRQSVVDILAGLLRSNGGYLAKVIPYGGIVRGWSDELGIDTLRGALQGSAPSIAVVVGDRVAEPAGMGGFSYKAALELVLYHYANHPQSITTGRTSPTAAAIANTAKDPGLDVMLEHAEELLIGQYVGGALSSNPVGEKSRRAYSIKQIVPTREEELATDNTSTLWAQRFAITVDRQIKAFRGVTQLLEEFRTIIRPDGVDPDYVPDPLEPGDQVLDLETTL